MTVLVIADHDNVALKPATRHAVTAGRALGSVTVLVAGGPVCRAVAEAAAHLEGVERVLLAEAPGYADGLAENLTPLLVNLARKYTHILAAATAFGKNLLPRVAALLDVQPVTDVVAVVDASTFKRPIYAGNAIATVQTADPIKVLTIRTTAFPAVGDSVALAPIDSLLVAGDGDTGLSRFVSRTLSASARPELTAARVVVSGGRGVGSKANFAVIEKLADALGAAVGASRAAVDAGFAPNDWQVGQTGKIVAPELYIAAGISGAIQHLAGMKDSKVIVAINKDPDAPIFQVADYGLVGDLLIMVPQLTEGLGK